jgi:hypothetical protein
MYLQFYIVQRLRQKDLISTKKEKKEKKEKPVTFFFFAVLGFELRTYTLSHSTRAPSPFFVKGFLR